MPPRAGSRMPPSNSVFFVARDHPQPDDLNCANFTGATEIHQPGSRAHLVLEEQYEFAALTLVNMKKRGVESIDDVTQDQLRQPGERHVEHCISEPVGLLLNVDDEEVTWAHVIDHKWTGLEPLVFYNTKMGELPPRLTDAVWKEATRRPDNLLPLVGAVHKQFDSGLAGPVPTAPALAAYTIGNEEALSDRLVLQGDEEGVFVPNPDDWELHAGDITADAHFEDVEYRVGQQEQVRRARSHEFDWWRFPRARQPEARDSGFYYPGEGATRSVVKRPGESWRQSVPLRFERARPAFQAFVRPGKAMSRFVWQAYARAASGEPLSFTSEGQAMWRRIKYKVALECARDWRSLAAALKNRPQDLPPLSPRLQYVRDHPDTNSGRRIWPALEVNVTTSARRSGKKRTHGDSDDESDSGRGQGPSRRPAPRTPTTTASTSSFAAAASASSTTPSSSSSSPSATRRSSAPTLAEDASSARIAAEEEHFQTLVQIMLFLEQRVSEGTLEMEDTAKPWSHIAGKLSDSLWEEVEGLVRYRRRLDQEISELKEEEREQRVYESLRRASERSQSPVEHFRRRMAGNVRCQTSPSPSAADQGSDAGSPLSPTESF